MTIERRRRHFGRLGEVARLWTNIGMPMLAVAICGAFAVLLLANDGSAQAVDTRAPDNVRIAAIGGDAGRMGGEAKSMPTGAKVSDDDAATIDLRTLLAQYAPAAAAEAQARSETVLLTIPLPAPGGVEDDIAKEHGVEIIDRADMPDFRTVVVRVPPGRPFEAVLAALKRDHRIKIAQTSRTYRPANLDNQAKASEGEANLKPAPERNSVPPSARGIAALQESGGIAKAAAPAARKALAPKNHRAFTSGATASIQRMAGEELFVGADGRLR
jgi:hypothetical protein